MRHNLYFCLFCVIISYEMENMMQQATVQTNSDKLIIAKALKRAGQFMGLKSSLLAEILNVSTSTLNRDFQNGIEPDTLKGKVSLMIIRMYRSLSVISGNNDSFVKHFLNTENKYFRAAPVDVIRSLEGLVQVNQYLDAMRGKT